MNVEFNYNSIKKDILKTFDKYGVQYLESMGRKYISEVYRVLYNTKAFSIYYTNNKKVGEYLILTFGEYKKSFSNILECDLTGGDIQILMPYKEYNQDVLDKIRNITMNYYGLGMSAKRQYTIEDGQLINNGNPKPVWLLTHETG